MDKAYALLSLLFLLNLCECNTGRGNSDVIEVLIWSGGSWSGFTHGDTWPTPNYLGHQVDKTNWNCPVDCRYTGDKRRLGNADAVIFEAQPLAGYYDEYKRAPPQWAQKYFQQYWVNFGYETHVYFNLYGDHGYMDYIDINMTFYEHSQVPITFHCFWGGGNLDDFLKPPPPKSKDKCIAFMATNCVSGGATHRTEYVRELMEHIHIDSLGKCLHNTDVPEEMRFPIYSDHGASMRNKVQVFQQYKFVLCFENNNITDYVTEKMPNVLQAGAVPIYMGAPNVHPNWTPGEQSIIQTQDFKSPKHLAEHLQKLCDNDEEYYKHFDWKKKGLSPQFKEKVSNCVFYGAECRLCQYIHEQRKKLTDEERALIEERKNKQHDYNLVDFNGQDHYIEIPSHSSLNVEKEFTISAWILSRDQGLTILDRGGLLTIKLKLVWKRNYLEICVKNKCYLSTHPMVIGSYYHFVITFKYEEGPDSFVKFYINGIEAETEETPEDYIRSDDYNTNPPLYIGTNNKKTEYFYGYLDDLSIWNIAVKKEKATKLVFDVLSGKEKGLVAYYSFNHARTEIIKDSTGVNDGKAMNNLAYMDSPTKPLTTVNSCL